MLLSQDHNWQTVLSIFDCFLNFPTKSFMHPTVRHISSKNQVVETFINTLRNSPAERLRRLMTLLSGSKRACSREKERASVKLDFRQGVINRC